MSIGPVTSFFQAQLYLVSDRSDFFQETSFHPDVYETYCLVFVSTQFFWDPLCTAQFPAEWLFNYYQVSCLISFGSAMWVLLDPQLTLISSEVTTTFYQIHHLIIINLLAWFLTVICMTYIKIIVQFLPSIRSATRFPSVLLLEFCQAHSFISIWFLRSTSQFPSNPLPDFY